MEITFDEHPCDSEYLHDYNAPASILLATHIAVAENKECPKKIRGTIQNDILKEYSKELISSRIIYETYNQYI